jgi:hypothetical protein
MASADQPLKLFDEFERTNNERADHSESQFKFLNRSARRRDERIRYLLEGWFSEYPHGDQHELKRRFESVKAQSYESASFELSVYAILRRLGCSLTPHPSLPGTASRPEFLVAEPNGSTFILEARLAGGESEAEASSNRLKDTIYDVLNRRLKMTDFYVDVTIRGTPKQQPSSKQIADCIQKHIDAEDADAIIAGGAWDRPRWTFAVDDGCTIEFRPHPRKREVRGEPPDRPLGIIGSEAQWVDDVTPIREAVLEKADRYGKLDQPYVVAINAMAPSLDGSDIIEALTELWKRERVKQVSAILLAKWLMPISAAHAFIALFHNPAAERRYAGVLTALSQGYIEDGKIRIVRGRELSDIFRVPSDWPRLGSDD